MESQIKILLVDANETFTAQLSSVLGQNPAFDVVGAANDGECAVELLQTAQADVLILDLLLPKLDGISVLKEASKLPKPPLGLVLSGFLTDYAAQAAEKLGVRYFISKPCNLQMVAERVMEIVAAERAEKKPFRQEAQVEALVTSIIHEIGVPAHVKGYQYLREAVRMVIDNHDVINRITKELYPGIARRYGTSSSKVERAMRHAIEVAWNRGRLESTNQMLGVKLFSERDKPTNGEFIALVADKASGE